MATRAIGKQCWEKDLPKDENEDPCTTKVSIANQSTCAHFGSQFCLQQRWDEFYFPAASLKEFWITCLKVFLCLCCFLACVVYQELSRSYGCTQSNPHLTWISCYLTFEPLSETVWWSPECSFVYAKLLSRWFVLFQD